MPTVAQIRSKFDNKLFTPYGKSVTLKSQGTPTVDNYGDIISDDFAETTITVVPYDINTDVEAMERFGDVNFGDVFFAVRYDETPSVGDVIVMEGTDWEIKDVTYHYLPDNLIFIVRCTKLV